MKQKPGQGPLHGGAYSLFTTTPPKMQRWGVKGIFITSPVLKPLTVPIGGGVQG